MAENHVSAYRRAYIKTSIRPSGKTETRLNRMVSTCGLLVLLLFAAAFSIDDDYNTWSYSLPITLNTTASGANVSGSVANFPVLIRLNPDNFGSFSQTLAGGADIRFSKPDGTHLPYQIERWVDIPGNYDTAEIWVKVPMIYGNDATQFIKMYYGKTGAFDSSKSSAVFETANGFTGVWHLNEDPTGSPTSAIGAIKDASSNANHATSTGTMTNSDLVGGMIGKGHDFDGTNDGDSIPYNATLDITNAITISAWVKIHAYSNQYAKILDKGMASNVDPYHCYDLTYNASAQQLCGELATGGAGTQYVVNGSNTSLGTEVWYLTTYTYNRMDMRLYVNGVLDCTPTAQTAAIITQTTPIGIGKTGYPTGGNVLNGILDEVRLENIARSPDWIKLCFENQKAGQTLVGLKQNLTWDISTASFIQAGSGTWGTNDFWTPSNGDGTSLVAWPGTGSSATFGGSDGTYTITVNGTQNVDSISFLNNGYTISGGSSLNLGAKKAIHVATGKSATISTSLSGTAGLTVSGGGVLMLDGANSYTGGTKLIGSTVSVITLNAGGAAGPLGMDGAAASNLVLDGGTLIYTGTGLSWDRMFTVGLGGGTITNNSAGAVAFVNTGSVGLSPAGSRTLTLSGSSSAGSEFAGIIGNNGGGTSLVKDGSGTWTLTGNNTYTGTTTINAGTLQIGNNSTTGSIANSGSITSSGTLIISRSDAWTYAGVISGPGTLVKNGFGSFTPAGANSYTGSTSINLGRLYVSMLANGGANSNIGASSNAAANLVINGGALVYTGGAVNCDRLFTLGFTYDTLDASGSGALNLTNTGAVTISGINSRTLVLTGNNSGQNSISAIIGDDGSSNPTSIIKSGTGTWVLAGNNTYTGSTTVSAGTLLVTGSLASTVSVYNGAVLGGTGPINGNVNTQGAINPGTSGTGILTFGGNLSLFTGGSIAVTLNGTTAGSGYDQVSMGSGTLDLGTGSLTVTLGYAPAVNDVFTIVDIGAGSVSGFFMGIAELGTKMVTYNGNMYTFTVTYAGGTGNDIVLTCTAITPVAYKWDVNSSPGIQGGSGNWGSDNYWTLFTGDGTTPGAWPGAAGYSAAFGGTGGPYTVTVVAMPYVDSISFENDGYTISGGSSIEFGTKNGIHVASGVSATIVTPLNGTGGLSLYGGGTLILSGVNTYTGTTKIENGTLRIAASNELLHNYSMVNIANAPGAVFDVNGWVETVGSISGGGTSGGNILLGSGTLNVGGDNMSTTYGGVISGAGALAKTGIGVLTLTGANLYTGSTTIGDGTLQIGSGGATGSIASSTNIMNSYALVFNRSGSITFNNVISGAGTLENSGTGTLTLSGSNTYTGVTTISAGAIAVATLTNGNTGCNLGAAPPTSDRIFINGGALIYTGTGHTSDRLFSAGLSGATITANGSGALVLNGAGTMGFGGPTGSRTVTFNGISAADNSFSGIIGDNMGATSVVKGGSGLWNFSGVHTYTGPTSITAGTLRISGMLAAGSTVTVSGGATLGGGGTINGPVNCSGSIEPGAGNPDKLTVGDLTLGGGSLLNMELGSVVDTVAVNGNLVLDGILNISAVSGFAIGTYTVITYTGAITDNILSIGSAPVGYQYSISVGANKVNVIVSLSTARVWTGLAGNANWNSAANWAGSAVPIPSDSVVFMSSNNSCVLDDNAAVKCLVFTSGFTGAFSPNGKKLTVEKLLDMSALGSVTYAGSDTICFNGASAEFKPKAGDLLPMIQQIGNGSTHITGNRLKATYLLVAGGTLDLGSGLNDTITGMVKVTGGSIDFNTSKLTAMGTVDLSGAANLVNSGGLLEFSGASAQDFYPRYEMMHPRLVKNNGYTLTIRKNRVTTVKLTVNGGTVDMDTALKVDTVFVANLATLSLDARTTNVDTVSFLDGGGTLNFGATNLHVSHGLFINGFTTFSGDGRVVFFGPDSMTFKPGTGFTHARVEKYGSGKLRHSGNALNAVKLFVNEGEWLWDVSGTSSVTDTLALGDGQMTMSGSTVSTQAFIGNTGTLWFNRGTLSIYGTPGTVDLENISTIEPGTGVLQFSGSGASTVSFLPPAGKKCPAVAFNGSGSDIFTLAGPLVAQAVKLYGGLFEWNDGFVHQIDTIQAGGGSMDFGSSTVEVTIGNADLGGLSSCLSTTGMLSFSGSSGIQSVAPASGVNLPEIEHNGTSTLMIAGGSSEPLVCKGLNVNQGSFNPDGHNLTINGDFIVTNGTGSTIQGLDGITITVNGGTASFSGQSGNPLYLVPATPWNITMAGGGALSAVYSTIGKCTVSGATGSMDQTCVDAGGNSGWMVSQGGTPPVDCAISIADNNGFTNDPDAVFTVSATGADKMRFSLSAANESAVWIDYSSTHIIDISAGGDGAKQVFVQFRDNADNRSGWISASTIFDTQSPVTVVATTGSFTEVSWSGFVAGATNDVVSGAENVIVTIIRQSDGGYWSGTAWTGQKVEISAAPGWSVPLPAAELTDGIYSVEAYCIDRAGNAGASTGNVSFSYNRKPVCQMSATPQVGLAPLEVTFTDNSSGIVDTRRWNFGDGTTAATAVSKHSYTIGGTYEVQLAVWGPGGADSIVGVTIVVGDTSKPLPVGNVKAIAQNCSTLIVSWTPSASPDADSTSINVAYNGYAAARKAGAIIKMPLKGATVDTVHLPPSGGGNVFVSMFTGDRSGNWSDSTGSVSALVLLFDCRPPDYSLTVAMQSLGDTAAGISITTTLQGEKNGKMVFGFGGSRDAATLSLAEMRYGDTTLYSGTIRVPGWWFAGTAVADSSGNRSTLRFDSVYIDNIPPRITISADTTAIEDTVWTATIDQFDFNGDSVFCTIAAGPKTATLTGGRIEWTPDDPDVGRHTIIVAGVDGRGALSSDTIRVVVANREEPPQVSFAGDSVTDEDRFWQGHWVIADPDSGATHTLVIERKPSWITVGGDTLSGTPLERDVGSGTLRCVVTDNVGLKATMEMSVRVRNVNDPPVLVSEDIPKSVYEKSAVTATLKITDEDRYDTLSFFWIVPCPWMAVDPPVRDTVNHQWSIVLHGAPQQRDTGNAAFVLRVSDSAGAMVVIRDTVRVLDADDPPSAPKITRRQAFGAVEYSVSSLDDRDTSLMYSVSLRSLADTSWMRSDRSGDGIFRFYPLMDGRYRFTAHAADRAGLETVPVNDTLVVSGASTHVTGDTAWEMISVPAGMSTNKLSNTAYLLHWNEAVTERQVYHFYQQKAELPKMEPGLSYWRKGSARDTLAINGDSLPAEPVTIPLTRKTAGWNQISSPYPYPVVWRGRSSVIWKWNSASGDFEESDSILEPWSGYWVQSDVTDSVSIDPVPAFGNGKLAKQKRTWFTGRQDWALQAVLTTEDGRDAENRFGVLPGANDGFDRFDRPEPPPMGDRATLFFPHADWKSGITGYAADFRKKWAPVNVFEIGISGSSREGNGTIRFDGHSRESPLYLFMTDGDSIVAVKPETDFKVRVGTADTYRTLFVSDNPDIMRLLPMRFSMGNAYPNPCRPSTRIAYVLPYRWEKDGKLVAQDYKVSIELYDIMGRKIRTLVYRKMAAGSYQVVWDGKNNCGRIVASGHYYCRLRADKFESTRNLMVVW